MGATRVKSVPKAQTRTKLKKYTNSSGSGPGIVYADGVQVKLARKRSNTDVAAFTDPNGKFPVNVRGSARLPANRLRCDEE